MCIFGKEILRIHYEYILAHYEYTLGGSDAYLLPLVSIRDGLVCIPNGFLMTLKSDLITEVSH